MKVNEIPGIYFSAFELSPETIKAQRLAELKDLAEYRQRHLKAIQDWSDPVKRAAMQAMAKVEEDQARGILKKSFKDGDPEIEYAKIAVQKNISPLNLGLTYMRPEPIIEKVSFFQKIMRWIRNLF